MVGPQGDKTPLDFVPSKSHIKGLIACTGLWMAGGRFGVTWKLVQARVRKPVRLLGTGVCHLLADSDDDELLQQSDEGEGKEEAPQMNSALADSGGSDAEEEEEVVEEEKPKPKKKKVVRRKKTKKSDA